MNIVFLRHGESDNLRRGEGAGLTRRGRRQARAVSKVLKGCNISAIYCSTLVRAERTARIISRKLGIGYSVIEGIEERLRLEGSPSNDAQREFWDNYFNVNYDKSVLGKESPRHYFKRNFVAFDKIINKHYQDNEDVLIIAHSSTLYALVAYFYNVQDNAVWLACSNCGMLTFEKK